MLDSRVPARWRFGLLDGGFVRSLGESDCLGYLDKPGVQPLVCSINQRVGDHRIRHLGVEPTKAIEKSDRTAAQGQSSTVKQLSNAQAFGRRMPLFHPVNSPVKSQLARLT